MSPKGVLLLLPISLLGTEWVSDRCPLLGPDLVCHHPSWTPAPVRLLLITAADAPSYSGGIFPGIRPGLQHVIWRDSYAAYADGDAGFRERRDQLRALALTELPVPARVWISNEESSGYSLRKLIRQERRLHLVFFGADYQGILAWSAADQDMLRRHRILWLDNPLRSGALERAAVRWGGEFRVINRLGSGFTGIARVPGLQEIIEEFEKDEK